MTRPFGSPKPTLAELQAMFRYGMPHDQDPAKMPAFMHEAARPVRTTVPKTRRAEPENDLQITCCKFLDLHPKILYWATPNHLWIGKMSWAKINYLKKQQRMGLRKGMPDLNLFFRNRHGQPTLCLAELKAGSNAPSDEQQACMDACNERGGFTAVVRSLDDLQTLLQVAHY